MVQKNLNIAILRKKIRLHVHTVPCFQVTEGAELYQLRTSNFYCYAHDVLCEPFI